MASVAYMDPGNFATNIQAGSTYGYRLLWVVLLANVMAMLFQAMSAKLGIVTGRSLAELCREHFSHQVVLSFCLPLPLIALVVLSSRSAVMGKFVSSKRVTSIAAGATAMVVLC